MSKKKESKMESPIKVTDYLNEKVEKLTKDFEHLAKLHDDNCERGNIEKKLEQCNYITQETFLKNSVDLMMRIDVLEKKVLCQRCAWIIKYRRIPTIIDTECPSHSENCGAYENQKKYDGDKPKIGEIWKDNLGYHNIILHSMNDIFGFRYKTLKYVQHKRFLLKDDIEIELREKTQEELIKKIC